MGQGPLQGYRIVEFAGLGPTPFCAMTLADMGADIVRVERVAAKALMPQKVDILNRGRRVVELDLKSEEGRKAATELVNAADGLIEGMRPGVMERLGLGPDAFETSNPKLVYGRMTGWGQEGPLAHAAGHDINYISLSGALHATGPADKPVFPLNLLGDFGGGGLYLAFGMVCAFLEAQRSGRGQVVDAAIVDGVPHLGAMIYSMLQSGLWQDKRESNILDGAAPFYGVFECSDGKFISIGAIEPQFYAEFLERVGLQAADLPGQHDRKEWARVRALFAQTIRGKTRDAWTEILEGTDACMAPVLSLEESYTHPHNVARGVFEDIDGIKQPAAAPRLSRTPGKAGGSQISFSDAAQIVAEWSK